MQFEGILAVTITPFKEDYSIDMKAYLELVDFMVDNKVNSLIINGSTGEFASMSDDERYMIVDKVIKHVHGRVPVIVGCSANSTIDVIKHCKHAEDHGAQAIMLVHPFYCLPTEEELHHHYLVVDKAVNIPIMIYNNPFTSGIDMTPMMFKRVVENTKNIRTLKESSSDVRRVHEVIRLCGPDVTVVNGWDDIIYESLCLGAKGWVAGTANIVPKQCVELYKLTCIDKNFEKAQRLYYQMLELLTMVEGEGMFVQYIKAGLKLIGKDGGIPRPPMLPPNAHNTARLRRAIDQAIGLS